MVVPRESESRVKNSSNYFDELLYFSYDVRLTLEKHASKFVNPRVKARALHSRGTGESDIAHPIDGAKRSSRVTAPNYFKGKFISNFMGLCWAPACPVPGLFLA